MNIKNRFHTSLIGLKTNKSRSLLTILGIVIGIASVILIFSVINGARNVILAQVQAIGTKTISVEPGKEPKGPSDFGAIFTTSLKDREVDALKNSNLIKGVSKVSPGLITTETVSYKGETKVANILGTSPEFAEIFDIWPVEGEFLQKKDIDSKSNVLVIGYEIKKELFGESDALGSIMKVADKNFKIIGVLDSIGQKAFLDIDNQVFLPVSTVQTYLLGVNHYNFILVEAENEAIVSRLVKDIKITFRELHNITDPDNDDFRVYTQNDAIEMVAVITSVLTLLLVSLAAISLVVGGIGIMNIMLVSVVERTREIGLRKAVGATSYDILIQFLLESVSLTFLGGIIGIIFGAFMSYIVSLVLTNYAGIEWDFVFSINAAILGFSVSAIIGLIFGIYPAKQAAKKSPVEALRYE